MPAAQKQTAYQGAADSGRRRRRRSAGRASVSWYGLLAPVANNVCHRAPYKRRAPLVTAAALAGGAALLLSGLGAWVFVRITKPGTAWESEERYRSLFELAGDLIFIVDPADQRILDANQKAARRLGYSREELLALTLGDIEAPRAKPRHTTGKRSPETTSMTFEQTLRRKDGTEIPVEVSTRMIEVGGREVFQNLVRDITERRKAEEERRQFHDKLEELVVERTRALRRSEAKYRDLVETSRGLIFRCDSERCFTYLNPAWEKATGYTREKMLGRRFAEFKTPEQAVKEQTGNYVRVSVNDTGTGMSPEVIAHAFEPFFTTKDVAQGSGLGLSMVYGFVKQSGGHVRIKSAVGRGTRVELYLPRVADAVPVSPPERRLKHASGGETILVVEDELAVRQVVVTQLRELGYRVLEAGDGPAALILLAQEPVLSRVRQSHPELSVVMITGHGSMEIAISALRLGAAAPLPALEPAL